MDVDYHDIRSASFTLPQKDIWEIIYACCHCRIKNLYREEERELERRIAQVAKEQAVAKQKKADDESAAQTARSQASDLNNERKRKLVKAMEIAETRFYSHNLKVYPSHVT